MKPIERLWEALDELMVELNKKQPDNKKSRAEILSGNDHHRMERAKREGEALGLARAIAIEEDKPVDAVREEAIRRYVGE